MEKVRLELSLLLPQMADGDECVSRLTEYLQGAKGIQEAHIVRENGRAELCLHVDPNLLPLSRVERLAREAGAEVTTRYRHETIPFTGLDAADAAETLADALRELPGMLHAEVNYAAGLAFVAYDSTQLDRARIEEVMHRLGATVVTPEPMGVAEEEHDHGSAPPFLPHWIQERWTLLLVGLAGLFFLIGWIGERFLGLPGQAALVFYLLAYVAGGYDIATHAIPGLFRAKFDTDVLMLAAAAGAAILGEWAEGAFLLFLFALGHAGEHYALDRARRAINALGELMPKTARLKRGDQIVEVPVETLQVGDVVVVRPGDRIPVDGEILQGQSAIDQSPVTGESVPVDKGPGDPVFAGTVNQTGSLEVQVTRLARDSTLSRIMQMVAEAQSQQSPTQQFTQRFTAWFVPAVLVADVLVILLPPLLGWMPLAESFYRGMLLLVAASPCALAIGTPASVLAGIAQAARNGVLIKGGVHLENLGIVRAMAFDKTGTITTGQFQVTDVVPWGETSPEELLRVAAAVEQHSSHPLAQAVVEAAKTKQLSLPQATQVENVPGKGIRGALGDDPVWIGSPELFRQSPEHELPQELLAQVESLAGAGKTVMIVGRDGVILGLLALADMPRPGVQEVLRRLRELGIRHLVMLTGDNEHVARRIAQGVGITDVRASLLPEEKLAAIHELQERYGALAMVGDGVNDAPALAAATVGIAMGGAGTAVALETADVALMADDLGKLPFAVGLSRASRAIIRQNLGISLGVIALLLITSVVGWMELSGAVVIHEGSTILVVVNALRLLRYKEAV